MNIFHQVFVFFAVVMASVLSYPLFEDQDGELYQLVPLQREKRGFSWDYDQNKATVWGKVDGTIYKDDKHDLSGSAFAQKDFNKRTETYRGGVDYSHDPSHTNWALQAEHNKHQGTDLSAQAKWNIVDNKQGGVDLTGYATKHVGGGPGRDDAGVMLNGHVNVG